MTMNGNRRSAGEGANAVGHRGVVSALTTAVIDIFSKAGQLEPLGNEVRIEGKVCLVTGANTGLGKATSIQLARRGGRVIMACRRNYRDALAEVKARGGSNDVELMQVDLADTTMVHGFCDRLKARHDRIDIAVMNAGLMPLKARRSPQGFEVMFAVHFLANRLLSHRLLEDGMIRAGGEDPPRIIFVSSEAHQSSDPIDFENFGAFRDYGMKDGLKHYGLSKLHLCTLASELSRRLVNEEQPAVDVFSLCPGPIASDIAREAPGWLKPVLGPVMKSLFHSPEKAAIPVIYLACSPSVKGCSGLYLHMMREKSPSPHAMDEYNGARLWELSAPMVEPGYPGQG